MKKVIIYTISGLLLLGTGFVSSNIIAKSKNNSENNCLNDPAINYEFTKLTNGVLIKITSDNPELINEIQNCFTADKKTCLKASNSCCSKGSNTRTVSLPQGHQPVDRNPVGMNPVNPEQSSGCGH